MPMRSVTALFEEQVARSPNASAVRDGSRTLTYLAVNHQANQFARYLQSVGVQPGDIVGVCVDRSAEMLVVILGILKAGAAYLPLDPGFPRERLQYMLENAQVALLVKQERVGFLDSPVVREFAVDDDWQVLEVFEASNLQVEIGPADLAYIIYTSGSTGTPKGVRVCHGNVVNFLQSMAKVPGLGADDALLAVTTISFDIHVLELFLPLMVGASIRMVSKTVAADAFELVKELSAPQITVMQATPTTWRMVIAAGWEGRQGFKVLIGGEPFPQDLVRSLYDRSGELWNMYGPTETTVWSTCYRITDPSAKPFIGKPIDNTQVYVVRDDGQLAQENEEGELYIGGAGVTCGYHRLDEVTRERFVANPFEPSLGRVYKTGDLARLTASGDLEHLGRLDDQIKFHGYRIELGDVETALNAHPNVEQTVVVVTGAEASQKHLVAFYSSSQGELDRDDLRSHCARKLPGYMIPNGFVHQLDFPLTPNGKVDRKALAAQWQESVRKAETLGSLPSGDFEKALVVAWQKVLEFAPISIDDTFIDVGGDSITAFELVQEMELATGVKFPLHIMLANPSIRDLVDHASATESLPPTSVVPLQPKGSKSPVLCLCGVNLYKNLADSLGQDHPTYGIYAPIEFEYMRHALAGKMPKISVHDLAQKYCAAIVRNRMEPPHFLVGFSFGGVVAVETARLLRDRGHRVAAVILLDSLLPHAVNSGPLERLKALCRSAVASSVAMMEAAKNLLGSNRLKGTQKASQPRALLQNQAVAVRNLAYTEAGQAYARSGCRYDGRVILVKASEADLSRDGRAREDYGWSDVLGKQPEVHCVRGGHLDILQDDAARETAAILQRYLRECEPEPEVRESPDTPSSLIALRD